MRASRLLSILILLQLRQRLTAEELAEEFEVSVRTIYRDIDALSAAGVPVYGDRGPGGGFQLLDGYRTKLTGLDASEAEAMLLIGLPGEAQAMGLGDAATRARNKLLAALPKAGSEEANRIAGRFHLDSRDWYRAARPTPFLSRVARAVLDRRLLTMTYDSWKARADWRVEPLGLVLKAGHWYLVGRGHGKVRISTYPISSRLRCLMKSSNAPVTLIWLLGGKPSRRGSRLNFSRKSRRSGFPRWDSSAWRRCHRAGQRPRDRRKSAMTAGHLPKSPLRIAIMARAKF